MIEIIISEDNIQEAIEYLQGKSDSAGADGVRPSELKEYWALNHEEIIDAINKMEYSPGLTRQFDQVSKRGKKRVLSLMCAPDRMLARSVSRALSEWIDNQLSNRCFAYRKGVGTKDIADFSAACVAEGMTWVANTDVKDFFDTIPHKYLYEKISNLDLDEKMSHVIHEFVECRIENEGGVYRLARGILQGNPCSPVLSNIYLMDFDRYMTEKYRGYCRYGDDIRIYTSSKKDALQSLDDAESRLKECGLTVNEKKRGVYTAINLPCFGYELYEKNNHVHVRRINRSKSNLYAGWQEVSMDPLSHAYHVASNGVLTRQDYTILFENEGDRKFLPVEDIDSISVYSNIVFSTNFFSRVAKERLVVNIVDRDGENVGRFLPAMTRRSIKVEMAQISNLSNSILHLELAKKYQKANVFNIRANLRYYARRSDIPLIEKTVQDITELIRFIEKANSVEQLMIAEAQARQKYYRCFNEIMHDENFIFKNRTRRPPQDALNAMISFGNTLLYNYFASEIYKSELDIRIGILHSSYKRQENLNLDLADLFKPVLVDRTIFTLVNRHMINSKTDFEKRDETAVYMTYRGKRIFIKEFEQKLTQTVNIDGKDVSYKDLLKNEVRKLVDYYKNGTKYQPYKYVN